MNNNQPRQGRKNVLRSCAVIAGFFRPYGPTGLSRRQKPQACAWGYYFSPLRGYSPADLCEVSSERFLQKVKLNLSPQEQAALKSPRPVRESAPAAPSGEPGRGRQKV
jgi:hypothetical protein